MASVPVRLTRPLSTPGPRRVRLALAAALTGLKSLVAPHKASLAKLLEMPLAVLGTGCIDFAAFRFHVLGWVVTGISLWVWNEILADDSGAT